MKEIEAVNIVGEMRKSFLDYSMSVIVAEACNVKRWS